MNRRNFLAGIGALVGGLAVNEAIPFGRVWSFPSNIVIPRTIQFDPNPFALTMDEMRERYTIPAMTALWDNVDRRNAELLKESNVFLRGEVGTLYGFDLPS